MTRRPSPHAHGRSEVWERTSLTRAIRAERHRLGRFLRALREEKEFSQERASEMIGIHPKHLQRIERGTANVTIATLVAISHAFRVPVRRLFGDETP